MACRLWMDMGSGVAAMDTPAGGVTRMSALRGRIDLGAGGTPCHSYLTCWTARVRETPGDPDTECGQVEHAPEGWTAGIVDNELMDIPSRWRSKTTGLMGRY